jgi:hypothetical protein
MSQINLFKKEDLGELVKIVVTPFLFSYLGIFVRWVEL